MDYLSKIKHWDDINVGDVQTFTKTMTQVDVTLWVGLTGDMNPVHIDAEYGKTTRFGDVIVPGSRTYFHGNDKLNLWKRIFRTDFEIP